MLLRNQYGLVSPDSTANPNNVTLLGHTSHDGRNETQSRGRKTTRATKSNERHETPPKTS